MKLPTDHCQEGRREFLRLVGGAAAACAGTAVAVKAVLPEAEAAAAQSAPPVPAIPSYDWTQHRWGYGVDATKCIGCLRCVEACKLENDVAEDAHHFRTWVERYVYLEGEDKPRIDSHHDPVNIEASGSEREYRFANRYKDAKVEKAFFVPKLCNHCTHPACVQVCPTGATYRTKDGVVLIDQEKCRGWRMCVSGCPYKKIYYNWSTGKSEKCTLCYPRLESGQPTVCSETCVGRIRYLGVMLYDADRIAEAAAVENEKDLYDAQLGVFLDPNDQEVVAAARAEGIPEDWIKGARNSPIWKMAMEWKIAFPLHPEYRTLPMVWYVPPLSPIQNAVEAGRIAAQDDMPDVHSLRIPVRYLANMLTVGDEAPVVSALERMLAMRAYMRSKSVDGVINLGVAKRVGLTPQQIDEMYQLLAIANYEDRFVIPTTHRELVEDAYDLKGGCGFTDGNGCSTGHSRTSLFGGKKFRSPQEFIA